jgi:DedD protein
MDRALIERMVGAIVLVVLIVVVAPALLDGRDSSGPLQQPTGSGGQNRTEVIMLNGPAGSAPLAESSAVEASKPKEVSRPTEVSKPRVKSAQQPAQQSAQPTGSQSGNTKGFAVQIGSFSQQENARQFAGQLSGEGFAVFVSPGRTASGSVYRVYAGPRATRNAAEKLAMVLGDAGYKPMVIDLDTTRTGGVR